VKTTILNSVKNFVTSKNMVMKEVDSVAKQITSAHANKAKLERHVRSTRSAINSHKQRMKYAKRNFDSSKRVYLGQQKTYNIERRRYYAAKRDYERRKRAAARSKRRCRKWGWLSFGVTCIIHLVKKGNLRRAVSRYRASSSRYTHSRRQYYRYRSKYYKYRSLVNRQMASYRRSLSSLITITRQEGSLTLKLKKLSELSRDLKLSTTRVEAILAPVRSMTSKKDKVSKMMATLKSAIETSITRIKQARIPLKIDYGSIKRLEKSFEKLNSSIRRLETSKNTSWSLEF